MEAARRKQASVRLRRAVGRGWGSTREEQFRPLPGDEIIPQPACATTHAITIDSGPHDVWPWLVQMGYGRGGWYTPAFVDRLWGVRNPSTDEILGECQHLAVGDIILDGPPGTAVFRVEGVDPPRSLLLHSRRHPVTGVAPDPAGPRPGPYVDFSWSFVLEPIAPDATRLLLRARSNASPAWLNLFARAVLTRIDIVMGRWMLRGIRRRAESGPLRRRATPPSRRMILDASRATRRNSATGFFQCDVTAARGLLASRRDESNRPLSLTAFVCGALARAVAAEPLANSVLDLRNRVVSFDDVDLMVMIESEVDGRSAPIGRIIRSANRKSVEEITNELRRAQAAPLAAEAGRMLQMGRWVPAPLRRTVLRWIDRNPRLAKRTKGTVSVSSVGMFARGGGWGLGALHHTVGVIVGGITARSVEKDGRLDTREFLSITFSVDHDIIDGAPAARVAAEMRRIIESPGAAMMSGAPQTAAR